MISFIIIGKNEGWKLSKCFKSVFETIECNELTKYEVIYVDSNSTDDSIERAKQFREIKIFKITGACNAAIARNIGARESNGKTLFFIDGDMELLPSFLPHVLIENDKLIYPFLSGQVRHFNHNEDWKFIHTSWQYKNVLHKDLYSSTSGGIFLITSALWFIVGGMDINFKKGEDHDLALRLTKNGYPLLRQSQIIANHNTIQYIHKSRMWSTLFSGDISYSISFLLRKHLFNRYIYKNLITTNYTTITLMFCILIAIIFDLPWIFLGYMLILIVKTMKNKKKKMYDNLELILFYFIRDLLIFYYLFLPMKKSDSNKEKVKYECIQ